MRPIVEIIRLEEADSGTIGILRIQKEIFCFTLEPPDLLNKQMMSSIPAQQYIAKRYQSSKYGETFIVTDVPGRTGILFHWGNTASNTAGCIILGKGIALIEGRRGLSGSKDTWDRFMEALHGHEKFHLTIKEEY